MLGFDAGKGVDASVAEAVGGAFEGDDVRVVDDAVDHRGGDDLVSEDAGPGAEPQVAGQDEGGVLVPGGDELAEQDGGVLLDGQVADLVDDDQAVAASPGQPGREPATVVGLAEAGDPVGGRGEQDSVAAAGGGDSQGGGQDVSPRV